MAGEPTQDIPSAHTGFYTQCSKGKDIEKNSPRYAQCDPGLMEPYKYIHINLYTVMKNTRPCLPMYSGWGM